MKNINKFIKNLLSGTNSISSKRFISIYALILFTIVLISHLFGIQIQSEFIYVLAGMILGSSAMTLIQK